MIDGRGGKSGLLEEDMGGEEEDMGCGGLDALLVTSEDAIKDTGEGEEALAVTET